MKVTAGKSRTGEDELRTPEYAGKGPVSLRSERLRLLASRAVEHCPPDLAKALREELGIAEVPT